MKYSQPDFYRFNEDSFYILDFLEKEITPHSSWKVADFGAGSGVLGIEFALKYSCSNIDFYEIQKDFIYHLKENTKYIKETRFGLINDSFYNAQKDYDLILSNPPYFFLEDSRIPSCEKRRRCRFISKGEEISFLKAIEYSLKEGGISIFSFPASSDIWLKAIEESPLNLLKQQRIKGVLVVSVVKTDSL